jgi:hypothetical protein
LIRAYILPFILAELLFYHARIAMPHTSIALTTRVEIFHRRQLITRAFIYLIERYRRARAFCFTGRRQRQCREEATLPETRMRSSLSRPPA